MAGAGVLALVYGWTTLPVIAKSSILWVGWPMLAVLTTLQTLTMLRQLLRRQYGFRA